MVTKHIPIRRAATSRRHAFRPLLELLEDRRMMSVTDPFEGPSFDPFWTSFLEKSGDMSFSNAQVHSGNKALRFQSTVSHNDKWIGITHSFASPVFGRFTVQMYDTGADVWSSNAMGMFLHTGGTIHGLYVPDYDLGPGNDGSTYVWQANNNAIRTAVDRTRTYHQFTIDARPESTTYWIDGMRVGHIASGIVIRAVTLQMYAPNWRPAFVSYFDTFSFTEYGNAPPTANAGGPYTIAEGDSLTLDASASADPDGDVLTYSWDVNGDGVYGDATGVQPTLSWSQLVGLGVQDGPWSTSKLRVRVNDGHGHVVTSASTSLTVVNVPPEVDFTVPTDGVRGQTLFFTGMFTDPGADKGTVTVDYGDGSTLESFPRTANTPFTFNHIYTHEGDYTVTVTVTDNDGGTSSATQQVTVGIVAIQVDPGDPTKTALAIGGSINDDNIRVMPMGGMGYFIVLNDVMGGPFFPTGRIMVFGQAGDDGITIGPGVLLPAWLYGDDGRDSLWGGAGPDILHGGNGPDILDGGANRNLLIGGRGADELFGNADEDILIAGYTRYDKDPAALVAIMNTWTANTAYASRVASLQASYLKASGAGATVFDDGDLDTLTGGEGQDLFFAQLDGDHGAVLDGIVDLLEDETAFDIELV